jgi:hypothetical protein
VCVPATNVLAGNSGPSDTGNKLGFVTENPTSAGAPRLEAFRTIRVGAPPQRIYRYHETRYSIVSLGS